MNRFLDHPRLFVHLLLIAAFVTAGISPACAFISGGQSLIEICAADGSVKTISVPAAQSPLAVAGQSAPAPAPHHSQLKDQCAFCFTAAQGQALAALPPTLSRPPLERTTAAPDFSAPLKFSSSAHSARAPPSYL